LGAEARGRRRATPRQAAQFGRIDLQAQTQVGIRHSGGGEVGADQIAQARVVNDGVEEIEADRLQFGEVNFVERDRRRECAEGRIAGRAALRRGNDARFGERGEEEIEIIHGAMILISFQATHEGLSVVITRFMRDVS